MSARGEFVLPTGPGLWNVVLRQDLDGHPVEFLNAHVRIAEGELVDLGDLRFTEAVTRCRLVDMNGAAVARRKIEIDDLQFAEIEGRRWSLLSVASLLSDDGGEVGCAFSRYDGAAAADRRGPAYEVRWVWTGPPAVVSTALNGSRTEIVVPESPSRSATPVVEFKLVLELPPGAEYAVHRRGWAIRGESQATTARPKRMTTVGTELESGAYVVECWNGREVHVEALEVDHRRGTRARQEIRPRWTAGRSLRGVAKGAVRRLLAHDTPLPEFLQRLEADGEFSLDGLPFEEFFVAVDGRVVRIPAGRDGEVALPD
jgi:hypothetical protein